MQRYKVLQLVQASGSVSVPTFEEESQNCFFFVFLCLPKSFTNNSYLFAGTSYLCLMEALCVIINQILRQNTQSVHLGVQQHPKGK